MSDAEREQQIEEKLRRLPVILQGQYARDRIAADLDLWDAMRAAPNPRIEPGPIVYRESTGNDTRPSWTQGGGRDASP